MFKELNPLLHSELRLAVMSLPVSYTHLHLQVYLYLIVHTSSFFYSFNKAMHLSTSRTNLDNRSFVSFTSLPLRLIVVAVFRFV